MAVFEVTIIGTYMGQTHENVLHFRKDAATSSDLQNLATEIEVGWLQKIKEFTPSEMLWHTIRVRNIGNNLDPAINHTIVIQGISSSASQMPSFVCMLLKIQTDVAGKTGRGRIYLSSPAPGHIVNGRFGNNLIDFVNVRLGQLKGLYIIPATTGWELGVCKRGDPSAFKHAIDLKLDTIPRCQRRRNIGVGV